MCLFPVASVTNADKKILSMCFYAQTLSCVGLRVCFVFCFLFFVFCFVCLSVLLKPGALGHIGIRFSFPPSPSPFAAEGSKQAKKKKTTRTLRVGQKTRLASILPSCFFNEPLWEEEKKKSKILCLFFSLLFLSLSLSLSLSRQPRLLQRQRCRRGPSLSTAFTSVFVCQWLSLPFLHCP